MNNMIDVQKKSYIWNTINSGLNAGMSALLLMIVNRGCGESASGMFALAFSIAQLMVTIAYFEVRSYQVTDINNKYSDSDYFMFRILSCLIMMMVSVGYVVVKNYTFLECILILLLCILKLYDAIEDYYIAVYQKKGLLYVGARKSSLRLIVSMAIFLGTIMLGMNMFISTIICVVISGVLVLYWFVLAENKRLRLEYRIDIAAMKGIFRECFSLFLGSYLLLYIGNAPKYAIDQFMEVQYQAYYGILYIPSYIINLFSGFVFKPLLNDLAVYYHEDRRKYRKLISKIFLILTGISLVVIVAGGMFGVQILSFMYAVDLTPYVKDFIVILCGGAVAAAGIIVYYMLTIMRYQQWMIVGYGLTAVAAYFLSPIMVKARGITGASEAFLLFNVIRVFVFLVILLWASACEKRSNVIL